MCDLSTIRRPNCHEGAGNRIKAVKLSKWELPILSSRSYWDGVCAEIEKKYKRVRDPYPSLFPLAEPSIPSASKARLPDDIKFKISPPSPMHKTQKSALEYIDRESNENLIAINVRQNHGSQFSGFDKKLKLPSLTPKKTKTKLPDSENKTSNEIKIYPKQSCPRHKNALEVKIFDDEISRYLPRAKSSIPKFPSVSKEENFVCQHRAVIHSKSTSASSTRSKVSQKSIKHEFQQSRVAKAPKLGMASLLPSFAKAVSVDSSVGTRESFDSEEKSPEALAQVEPSSSSSIRRRDFLRVPNLSFVSSHPSFRKLSLVDSCEDENGDGTAGPKEIPVMPEEEFLEAEKSLRTENKILTFKDESEVIEVEELCKTKVIKIPDVVIMDKKVVKKIPDYEKEYAYKALDVITNHKHVKIRVETDTTSMKKSTSSEECIKPKSKRISHIEEHEPSIDFKEVRAKLIALLSPEQRIESASAELKNRSASVTMYTSSRSTSGSSVDFENNAISVNASDVLQEIPKTKVFNRAYIDKCHACIYKPFKSPRKINRELPLATLKSVVDNPPEFQVSSSSSSSTMEVLQGQSEFDTDDDDLFDFPQFDEHPAKIHIDTQTHIESESKDYLRVSFDQRHLSPTSSTDITLSPKSQSDHHLKGKSISVQSSDRSKTSTPSIQSSDSDESSRPQEMDQDKLPTSKYMAPCHAPVVWRKSFEPLRALKQKKFQTLRAKAAAMTLKSSEGSASDSDNGEDLKSKLQNKKTEEPVPVEAKENDTKKLEKKKEKTKRTLVRMKTVADKLFDEAIQAEEVKAKRALKRAKTTFDLTTFSDEEKHEEEEEKEEETNNDKVESKEELPYAEAILMHTAASPPPPIMSTQDIIDIVKECLKEDFNASDLMDKLSNEFISRIEDKCENLENSEDVEHLRLGIALFRALSDSRRYLKSNIFNPNLEFSHKQPPLNNSRQLRRILLPKSYELVAPILGMPKYAKKSMDKKKTTRIREERDLSNDSEDEDSEISFGRIVHPPTTAESSRGDKFGEDPVINPYALFLTKLQRKAVVWRPLREEDMKGYDPEATLELRAARLMDKICKDFCEWLTHLGGNEQVIDEDTLKDMFEINFTAEACKAMQVVLREMPTVPAPVVKATGCRAANELESTRHQIRADLKLEKRPRRTHAFGRAMPKKLRFLPPRNRLSGKWLHCDYIPKDLETMDAVWEGIVHLDSVQTFIGYLRENPKAASTKLLKNLERRKMNVETVKQVDLLSAKIDNDTPSESDSEF